MGIKLGQKKLRNGCVSLFLDYNVEGERRREYLQMKLEPPVADDAKVRNRHRLDMAETIRFHREMELAVEQCCAGQGVRKRVVTPDFFLLFKRFLSLYKGRDINTCIASLHHLRLFVGKGPLPLHRINKAFCQRFYDYLLSTFHGATPPGYFKKFKRCLEECVERGLLVRNPADGIRLVQTDECTKCVLSMDEIARLARTSCRCMEVKRAFLFACFTGLRWCDVSRLTYASVDIPNRMIHLMQHKVRFRSKKAYLHLSLNDTALRLLTERGGTDTAGNVFRLPSQPYALRVIEEWSRMSGLSKHITFHCARHSFITNLMANGVDIKTVSELTGHSTVRHTERYIHVSDRLKREAVIKLDGLLPDG